MATSFGRDSQIIIIEQGEIKYTLECEEPLPVDGWMFSVDQMSMEFTLDFPPTKQNLIFWEVLDEKDGRYN